MESILSTALGLLSVFNINAAQAQTLEDVRGTDASAAVQWLADQGVVEGYSDGTFKADQDINRVEFLKIVLEASDKVAEECDANLEYPDVAEGDWFYKYVCSATDEGIVEGYPDGKFRPGDNINFAEAAKIVSKVEELELIDSEDSDWFADFVDTLNLEKVVAESLKAAGQDITRGEMAQLIWGLKTGNEVTPPEDELTTINSCTDLNSQLRKYYKRQNFGHNKRYFSGGIMPEIMESEMMMEDAVAAPMVRSTSSANLDGATQAKQGGGASDHSTTNVQEFGVDEADIIKNDGKYIYMIKNNTIRIVGAYPADTMAQVAVLKVDEKNFYPNSMYVDGNTLVVVGNSNSYYDTPEPLIEDSASLIDEIVGLSAKMIAPPYYGGNKQFTEVISYDISTIDDPKEIRRVKVEGNHISSRKIDDIVYLVTNKYQNYHWGRPVPYDTVPVLPELSDTAFTTEKIAVPCGDIFYFPNFEQPNYLIVSAIPIKDTSKKVGREMLLGGGEQVYASQNNLYVTRTSYRDQFYNTTDWNGWRYWPTTEIYKFELDGNDIEFKARGKVAGRMHNQFSLSEQGDKLRIATQIDQLGSQMAILDEDLNLLGKVDGIAPGENIKAVRYMGDRGYMITFKNVDPLFVIDLSTNTPKVLGELKIPGWSDYLHPYDDDHLIGLGKEVKEGAEDDGRLTNDELMGLKLAIYDVSDVSNPKEIHKKIIGDNGTYSEVLNNHKALLVDMNKNLMALPINVMAKDGEANDNGWQPQRQVFQGAFVYDLSLEDGFTLRGRATHYADDYWDNDGSQRRYGNHEYNVQRILYIGETFYTVSNNIVEAHSWDDVTELNRVQLDNKACTQIYDEDECAENSCRTVWREWEECYSDGEDFSTVCEDKRQFERCTDKS